MEEPGAGRGAATRERLIAAALALFGRRGYEGVGAREIAQAAAAPLSAIPYHFGTKAELYRAVLIRVTKRLREELARPVEEASRAVAGAPDDARTALVAFQTSLLVVMAARPESAAWAKLLVREHMDPSPAFDIVYQDAARGAIELMAALIARASEREPHDPTVLLEAFARMGEVLIFRTVQAAINRRLGWTELGKPEAGQIGSALANLARPPPRIPSRRRREL